MILRLKTSIVALAAMMALSASMASSASAQQGEITSDGPVTLIGTETGGNGTTTPGANVWTMFGISTECEGRNWVGHRADVTPHELISNGATVVTLTPLSGGSCHTFGTPYTVAVVMNGCDYALQIGEAVSESTYEVETDIDCPEGNAIETQFFKGITKVCTWKYASQAGIDDPHISVNASDDLSLEGTFTGFHVTRHGLCALDGEATTSTVPTQHVDITLTGTNEAEEPTGVTITD